MFAKGKKIRMSLHFAEDYSYGKRLYLNKTWETIK